LKIEKTLAMKASLAAGIGKTILSGYKTGADQYKNGARPAKPLEQGNK
jgi:hypothetical protein